MSKTASVESSEISAGTQTSHAYQSVGTRDDLVRRALALIPTLRARVAEADALRRLPAETVRDLKDSGVARVLQPARYGCQAPFGGMVDILRTIGRGCGSTAWCLAQYIGHNFMVSLWPPPARKRSGATRLTTS